MGRMPKMREKFIALMERIFENCHAEQALLPIEDKEHWYLQCSATTIPRNLNNSLLEVLIPFRKEQIAILGNIQQIFHCFLIHKDNRNYLRFLWYRDITCQWMSLTKGLRATALLQLLLSTG